MTDPDPAQAAFNKAIRQFRAGLKDQALYSQILATTSVNQVYDLTDKLQKEQGKGDHLRNLARIQPYLDRMTAYTGAIDTFVQAKPDILALIWGPIKLLIQWTSNLTKSLDALLTTVEEIGNLLPEFDHAAKLFGGKRHVNEVLALLFQDVLDFYLVSLKFFRMERWKSFFEALWPRKKEEIEEVISRMKDHTYHLRNEVRLEDIQEAYDARQLDIENFAKLEEANRKQEYNALETAIAPTSYRKKLSFLRGRVCEGTGDWLIKDPDLSKWLKVTQDSPKVIWLCGIPGAGKTYLAACVVKESMLLGHTLFVFLSHEHQDTSAMSVLHSLIFQLARKDPKLMDMVRYTDRDILEFDLSSAVKLFTNLAQGAGPVRIIIDGLDEIDETERVRLLHQMLKISIDCDEARILIASRPEADITSLLEKPSKSIRVDAQNTPSIHAFVMSRFGNWLQSHSLSPEDETEIRGLMGALAGQAKGMFLYARLILNGLDFLHSVDEIRRDLKVLPTDLNAAYDRILSRINESLPNEAARIKARKALGWIAYSPVALTIRELEQALIVNIGDRDQVPTGISTLEVVYLCGPVVEEVDGQLQLVHFTAKEYFFSPMIKNSLDPAECIMGLAKCCITYLCQHHHSGDLDNELFNNYVINGVYRLHHFASDNWARLVELYLRVAPAATKDSADLAQLIALIDLLGTRASEQYLQSEEQVEYAALETLQTETSMDAYELVRNELNFHREAGTRLFELGKGEQRSAASLIPMMLLLRGANRHVYGPGEWQVADPLLIRRVTASLQTALDRLICPPYYHRDPCYCRLIHNHYGQPFRCSFIGCDCQRLGFGSPDKRRNHSKTHDRPWTCDVPDCEYHRVGFISRQMRNRHLDQAHRVDEPPEPVLRATTSDADKILVLKELIRVNKLTKGSAAMQLFDSLDRHDQRMLRYEAASRGTKELMDLLCSKWLLEMPHGSDQDELFAAAVKSQNHEALRWIQAMPLKADTRRADYSIGRTWTAVMESEDPERMYQFVEAWLHAPFSANVHELRGDYLKENVLISVWNKLFESEPVPREAWSRALCSVADSTLSIRLARWLCDHGATFDYVDRLRLGPPLLIAAKKDTLKSAEFMRFALHQGADPECTPRSPSAPRGSVSRLRGPTGLHKWLNISWAELIEEAKEARRNSEIPQMSMD
ncbi:hypothetical protein CEP54_010009 [Fusarium duplospermum]|uniref:Uncharacterized protein n=1 Tax=Fusarium duplospermum TaxID=1325734 RepID=A0A428PMI3_9HYPO|nr:hypothetical protein CEP54_010009 [Fusarium duplospermum]